jgi:uncharacterized protein
MEPSQERTWAMFCHLGAFAGYMIPFGHIIAPLIIWQMKRKESAFVEENGKEALNFQLTLTIYAIIATLLALIFIGFFLLAIIGVFGVVMIVVAALKANNGESFRYPATMRFIK